MTDRELLELAAKAAGLAYEWNACASCGIQYIPKGFSQYVDWSPLTDDGDALRLAVALDIGIAFCTHSLTVTAGRWMAMHEHRIVPFCKDKAAATRLAVVYSAAAIGKDMP